MNGILKIVLSLSLSGALLILVLLLCKPLFKNRTSRRWQYYIWLVVIVRLLLPFTPQASPVGTVFHEAERVVIQADAAFNPGRNMTPTGTSLPLQRFLIILIQNLWLAWLVTALVLFIRKITIYQGFVKYIKAGCAEVSDTLLLDRLALAGEYAGIKKPVELYTNSLIFSPLLLGFFRPCIVLPTADLSDADFHYIILHELTHYKRRDMFYKWLIQFVICLHWFNPLVYLMSREIGQACELACDESIIKGLDAKGQRAYGDTLLNAVGAGGNYKDTLASVTLNESKKLLKERLGAIMIYHKKTKLNSTISLVLTIMLVCGATAIGAYAAPRPQDSTPAMPIGSNIVREGGVYYIFCDGADESDKPISGVTQGSIKFVLVRKDGYTSIGPFTDITRLDDEVAEQCQYMLKARSITQEEADLIMEAAANIQEGKEGQYKQIPLQDAEYLRWGVGKQNGAYYYKNERVRILTDLKDDNSFVNFYYDGLGTIDIRLMRGHNGDIIKIENLTQKEAKKILSELDVSK